MQIRDLVRSLGFPGQIHYNYTSGQAGTNQSDNLKDAMQKSGGMTGEKGQTPGVFQRMISYAHMPIHDMAFAIDNGPEDDTSINAYTDLVALGLRLHISTIYNWLEGYGVTLCDMPPSLREEGNYEAEVWAAKEREIQKELGTVSGEVKKWMDNLGLTPDMLYYAVVNPFQIDKEAYVQPIVMERVRDLGLLRLKIPKEYGGLGFNQREYDKVLRALTQNLSGTLGGIISAHSTIGSAPLSKYGTEEQKEYYLRKVAAGEGLCAFGLTERESGTDAVDGAETIAKKSADGKHWVLNGSKMFITNTQRSNILYVMAKVDDGIDEPKPTVFIVELPFRITDKKEDFLQKREELKTQGLYVSNPLNLMMIRGSNQAYIEFHDFKVPVKNKDGIDSVLGGIGNGTKVIFNSLNSGRAGFGSFCAGAASGALDLALKEAVQRSRFALYGGKLADMPTIKNYLSEMAVKVAALNATADLTTALIDEYPEMNIIAEAAAIKIFATKEAWNIGQTTARIFGGVGTMKGFPVELMLRDLWIPLIVEGVNEALKQHLVGVSAKSALKDSTSLRGIARIIRSRFHYEKGDLSFRDALWIQRTTKKLSFKALLLGAKNKEKTLLKQGELLEIADQAIELYALTAVLLKLRDKSIPEKEKEALKQYVQNVKSGNPLYPDFIADLYIDDAKIEVGEQSYRNRVLAT